MTGREREGQRKFLFHSFSCEYHVTLHVSGNHQWPNKRGQKQDPDEDKLVIGSRCA